MPCSTCIDEDWHKWPKLRDWLLFSRAILAAGFAQSAKITSSWSTSSSARTAALVIGPTQTRQVVTNLKPRYCILRIDYRYSYMKYRAKFKNYAFLTRIQNIKALSMHVNMWKITNFDIFRAQNIFHVSIGLFLGNFNRTKLKQITYLHSKNWFSIHSGFDGALFSPLFPYASHAWG